MQTRRRRSSRPAPAKGKTNGSSSRLGKPSSHTKSRASSLDSTAPKRVKRQGIVLSDEEESNASPTAVLSPAALSPDALSPPSPVMPAVETETKVFIESPTVASHNAAPQPTRQLLGPTSPPRSPPTQHQTLRARLEGTAPALTPPHVRAAALDARRPASTGRKSPTNRPLPMPVRPLTHNQNTSNPSSASPRHGVPNSPRRMVRAHPGGSPGSHLLLADPTSPRMPSPAQLSRLSIRQRVMATLTPGAVPAQLIGRAREQETVRTFWREHVDARKPGALYISGKPGTGKTATLNQLIAARGAAGDDTPTVCINCMTLRDPTHIYSRILQQLLGEDRMWPTDVALTKLKSLLIGADRLPTVVLVVDEVDQLHTRDNSVLYQLFSWPQQPDSSVVLVSIANALDLTERILPLLHRWQCQPETVLYEPYTKDELVNIVRHRMDEVPSGAALLQDAALKLCAAKVTAVSGDIRQTLDLCRRVLELSEKDKRPQIAIMASLFASVLGSDRVLRIKQMPLHQKLLLVALYHCCRDDQAVECAKVLDRYRVLAEEVGIPPLSDELYETLQHMGCSGYIHAPPVASRSHFRHAKCKLLVPRAEVEDALRIEALFGRLLQEQAAEPDSSGSQA
ncbi:uncharacterized protein MONBRDRAFT_28402 [Monosiga brevicollis MX1]|uniref:Cell division control protein n=1 Tax=Monosiga brevicollis TaxID=81824 RepID=A9V827_MONBE|nr:uncharacterized protein MONBRDRAFT_28402 [Monosiga brevicollis MX1]EDQ86196.1 predicted protein [Monosiga brevicollis MX1]|eukprot:XP_001748866.1 hypothetical protein [Monosiga brevicollis MX1]